MMYAGDLTPRESLDLLNDDPRAVIVDVRTAAEWTYVGTPDLSTMDRDLVKIEWITYPDGAPNETFLAALAQVAPANDIPVAFLCRSGVRSLAAAQAATAAGYERAYNISDGFEGPANAQGHRGTVAGWKAAGLAWVQS